MLRPSIISKEERDNILDLISIIAENTIKESSIYNFLNKSNIYQYQLPEQRNTKIILSKKVYKKLIKLAKYSNTFNYEEGCYLFGKKESNNIYFTKVSKTKSIKHHNSFITTPSMQKEILNNMNNKNINYICHVHTHPNNINLYKNTPSNQDLYTYAWLQEQFSTNDINFIGALITPDNYKISFNDICFIFYNKENKKFYKNTKIYYLNKGQEIPLEKIIVKNNYLEKRPIILKYN